MAKRYPFMLNGVRFLVNPRGYGVQKPLNMGSLPTQEGVQFQIWYSSPEVLRINGVCAGVTAFKELQALKDHFARDDKVSELYYKNRLYKGIIKQLEATASVDHLNRYNYTIIFQLLHGQKFAIEDFTVKKTNDTTLKERWQNTWDLIADDFQESYDAITKLRFKDIF